MFFFKQVGGTEEYKICDAITSGRITKPLVSWCIGTCGTMFTSEVLESLSKRRFCQHGRQPEVNLVVIDGEWWRQPFSFEINNGSYSAFTFVISNQNGWRHHSPSTTNRFTSGWRPCWQKRCLLKLSIIASIFYFLHFFPFR